MFTTARDSLRRFACVALLTVLAGPALAVSTTIDVPRVAANAPWVKVFKGANGHTQWQMYTSKGIDTVSMILLQREDARQLVRMASRLDAAAARIADAGGCPQHSVSDSVPGALVDLAENRFVFYVECERGLTQAGIVMHDKRHWNRIIITMPIPTAKAFAQSALDAVSD